jgi:phosphoribosylformylglycinamidine cyclo-ligase
MSSSRYENRGVSADKSEVHDAIKSLDKGLFPNAFCKILPDMLANDPAYCNIMHADTAGTKTSLAYMYWRETGDKSVWEGIVQDALVMNLDDMACAGCIDNFVISSTVGRNKNLITGEVLSVIINASKKFADKMAAYGVHLHLAGGETADVGDIVRTADVGFTAYGRLKLDDVISIDIKEGDYVVGLAGYGQATYEDEYISGIGCNGLTSARHDVLDHSYATKYPETFNPDIPRDLVYSGTKKLTDKISINGSGYNIGKLLLSPTRTFLPVLKPILDTYSKSINGIVHNTGGGQYKVEKFLSDELLVVKDNLLPTPPIFDLIAQESNTQKQDMYKVFNMGTRLEIYVSDVNVVNEIIDISKSFNIDAQIVGRVIKSSGRPEKIVIQQ